MKQSKVYIDDGTNRCVKSMASHFHTTDVQILSDLVRYGLEALETFLGLDAEKEIKTRISDVEYYYRDKRYKKPENGRMMHYTFHKKYREMKEQIKVDEAAKKKLAYEIKHLTNRSM